MKYFFSVVLFLPMYVWSIETMDNYYANDLLDAVDKAKQDPHHYDYSNNFRYKRTTAQSINLNRLNLEELDKTRINTTSSVDDRGTESISIVDDKNRGAHNIDKNISPKRDGQYNFKYSGNLQLNTQHQNHMGAYKVTGIEQNGTVISTPRP